MSGIPDCASGKIKHTITDHEACSQTGTDRGSHQAWRTVEFTKIIFGNGRHIEVLLQMDRQTELCKQIYKIDSHQRWRVRVIANGAVGIDFVDLLAQFGL